MANTKIPAELSSTPGIIDNSNATAITIDSSENVGIGTSADLNANLTVLDTNYTTSSLAGTGLNLRGSSTGNGTYSAALTFTNGYRTGHSAIAGVAENSDNDVMGIAFFTHASTGGTVATSETMRIDSSGNLLVGKTSTNTDSVGFEARATGLNAMVRASGETLILGRNTSDGGILSFRKDGGTIGALATAGGDLIIGSHNTCLRFDDSADDILPTDDAGVVVTNTLSLGSSAAKFKELWIGASPLDDYEEGTFTPTFSASNSTATGSYTKVGNKVTVNFHVVSTGGLPSGGSQVSIGNFPFTSGSGFVGAGSLYVGPSNVTSAAGGGGTIVPIMLASEAFVRLVNVDTGTLGYTLWGELEVSHNNVVTAIGTMTYTV